MIPVEPRWHSPLSNRQSSSLSRDFCSLNKCGHSQLLLMFCQQKHKGAWRQRDRGCLLLALSGSGQGGEFSCSAWMTVFVQSACTRVLKCRHRHTEHRSLSLSSHVRDRWILQFSSLKLSVPSSFWIYTLLLTVSANVAFSLFNMTLYLYILGVSDRWKADLNSSCADCVFNLHVFCLFSPYFFPAVWEEQQRWLNKLRSCIFYFVNSTATRSIQPCCRSLWCTKSVAHASLFWLHCASCIRNADIHSFGKHTDTYGNTHLCLYIFVSAHSHSFVNLADGYLLSLSAKPVILVLFICGLQPPALLVLFIHFQATM